MFYLFNTVFQHQGNEMVSRQRPADMAVIPVVKDSVHAVVGMAIQDDTELFLNQPGFKTKRFWRVLAVTWVTYASFIIARKPFGVVRLDVEREVGLTPLMSSMVDTAFLTTYSIGQLLYSSLKAEYSSRTIITIGLAGAAGCSLLFSMTSSPLLMVFLSGLIGVFSSFGWPSCVSLVTPWLGSKERGQVMGVWGSCQAVGSLAGNWLTASLLLWGWRSSYVGVFVAVGSCCLLAQVVLADHPNHFLLVSPSQWATGVRSKDLASTTKASLDGELALSPSTDSVHTDPASSKNGFTALSVLQLARLPSALDLAMSYFCQKLVRYSLLSWLPYYLTRELGYSSIVSGYVASSFDFGGVVGSMVSGMFSDCYAGGKRRTASSAIYLLMGTQALLLFALMKPLMKQSMILTSVISAAVGFFLFGCDTLMTGATLQDLTERLNIAHHAGSLSGFVGGIGSLGAILQGPVTAYLATKYGWTSVFYFLIGVSVLAVVFMIRPVLFERRGGTSTVSSEKDTEDLNLQFHKHVDNSSLDEAGLVTRGHLASSARKATV
ncbi:putative glycerol-3-phosphate transporter 3 [Diplonema papillatum]|nr:putative glycerol-3-phosphate transporter 3 [Diplonema papillatum]